MVNKAYHCIRRVPSAPRKGHSTPPLLGPCLLWPRSPISAAAELLFTWTSKMHNDMFYKRAMCLATRFEPSTCTVYVTLWLIYDKFIASLDEVLDDLYK